MSEGFPRKGVARSVIGLVTRGCFFLSLWLFPISLAAQTGTLQESIQGAVAAFSAGDYTEAHLRFESLESDFGREPEFQDPEVQRVLLPVRGFSALAAGEHQAALEGFKKFLKDFTAVDEARAFVRYSLGLVYLAMEDREAAVGALESFVEEFPALPEAELATLQRIRLLFDLGRLEEGWGLSEGFYQGDASPTLRIQGRLLALERKVAEGRTDGSLELLMGTDWGATSMPELAALAFAALRTGDELMAQDRPADALEVYRMVPPYQRLLHDQTELVERARREIDGRTGARSGRFAAVWDDYRQQTLQRLEGQKKALEETEDYTAGFQLRFGQAFLSLGRVREAWILFSNLAEDKTVETGLRQDAHYRWILAAYAAEDWDQALAIAEAFQEKFSDADLAPDSLFLMASAFQQKGRFHRANEVLDRLIENYPDHRRYPVWRYMRGFNRSMLEAYDTARADLMPFLNEWADHPMAPRASLYHALTFQFEGSFEQGLEAIDQLMKVYRGQGIYPELRYRRAAVLYARRQYAEARIGLQAFIEAFPGHFLIPEARVLMGDILMGEGRLEDAAAAFARVGPEAGSLFPYAVFQRGKIYQAMEDYERMEQHFRDYLARPDHAPDARISEALFWIGWVLERQDRLEEAFPLYQKALDQYGDDPEAVEISSVLTALRQLRERHAHRTDLSTAHPVMEAEGFEAWLREARAEAREAGRLTFASRLALFEAGLVADRDRDQLARGILLDLEEYIPPERMDPEVLARLADHLSGLGMWRAEEYAGMVLDLYPRHRARGWAYLAMARMAQAENDPEEADRWLRRIENELPAAPMAIEARLLHGDVLAGLGDFESAAGRFEEILRLRQARGRPHARALAGLARLHQKKGDPKRAIPYWQRVYTVYRAYPELVAEAYVQSAMLFRELEDFEAAVRSLEEMLGQTRLVETEFGALAESRYREWVNGAAAELPGEAQP